MSPAPNPGSERDSHDPLQELIQAELAGPTINDQDFLRLHPQGGESLRRRLKIWRDIQAAERRARESFSEVAGERTSGLREDLAIIQAALPGYEVSGCVQHGGQGVVYEARQRGTNRKVAVKLLLDGPLANERQRMRFEREVELIARLNHPNIVTVFEGGAARGRLFYTMSFIEGHPIDEYALISDLTPRQIVGLLIQLARAISYAHRNGVIHRDLKPDNLLVDHAGKPYVMDFGLAEDLWSSDPAQSITAPGQVLGTLPYMSPEQLGGQDARVDIQSDVYSLGVCLFKLLTDSLPFERGVPEQIRQRILNDEPLPLRRVIRERGLLLRESNSVNADLEAIVARALSKEKKHRYSSADAMADDLERYLRGEAVTARSDNRLYVIRRKVKKYWLPTSIAAALLISIVGAAVSIAVSSRQTAKERDRALAASTTAVNAVRTTLDSVESIMRRMAGGGKIAAQMLAVLDQQLPVLTRLVDREPAFAAMRVSIQEKNGDLALYRGQVADARRAFEAALRDVRAAAPGSQDAGSSALFEARLCRKLLPISANPQEQFDAALASCTVALRNSDSAEPAVEMAELLDRAGDWEALRDRLPYALSYYREAAGWADTAFRKNSQCGAESIIARSLRHEAEIATKLGLGGSALEPLWRSMALEESAVRRDPSNLAERSHLVDSRIRLAAVLRDGLDPDTAENLLAKAAQESATLVEIDPAPVEFLKNLANARFALATLLLHQQRCTEAQALIDDSLSLVEDARKRIPDDSELEECELSLLMARGLLLSQAHASSAACEVLQRTMQRRMEKVEQVRDAGTLLALAQAIDHWAITLKRTNQFDEAISIRKSSIELLARLRRDEPRNVEIERFYYAQLSNQALAHIEHPDAPNYQIARSLLDEACSGFDRLLESDRGVGWTTRILVDQATAESNRRMAIRLLKASKALHAATP